MIDRRLFTSLLAAAMLPASGPAFSQPVATPPVKRVRTPTLEIAYEESGPETGFPVLLMHGFPYDPRCYDEVVPALVSRGHRAIVPYLRGYGATRFLSTETFRSGQQAAIGQDLLDLMDALRLPRAVLVGFDWGGRAACVVGALWPGACAVSSPTAIPSRTSPRPRRRRRRSRRTGSGISYFHTERGRAGLTANRRALCKLLWRLWSPNWKFDDATYERTAKSFNNPDFVDIVIHSYRHRFGYAPGDPAFEALERRLAAQPPIPAPTIVLQGEGDGVNLAATPPPQMRFFTGPYQRRLIPVIGHDVPQEAPAAVAAAVLELL
jgi:pimeloyl-ACP methyl ester carboxylesterase